MSFEVSMSEVNVLQNFLARNHFDYFEFEKLYFFYVYNIAASIYRGTIPHPKMLFAKILWRFSRDGEFCP